MKKLVIFLIPLNFKLDFINDFKKQYKQFEPIIFSYKKHQNKYCHQLEKGAEFKFILKVIGDRKVKAVINRVDALEILHGQLVDHFKIHGPSYQAIICFKDKAKLQQLIEENDLIFFRPRTIISDLADIKANLKNIQFPLVIKPFAGAKSRGITKVNKASEIDNTLKILDRHFKKEASLVVRQSQERKVLIEEFIDGQQLTCTCYVDKKGKLHILNFVDVAAGKDVGQKHMQLVYRSCPSRHNEAIFNKAKLILQKLIKISGLRSTCIHPDFFVLGKKVYLIEVNVRIGGFRQTLLKLSTGVDLNKIAIDLALGKEIVDDFEIAESACACEVWEDKSGIIENITLPRSKTIVESNIRFQPGDKYSAPPIGNKPLADFFVKTKDGALKKAKQIRKKTKIKWK